MPTVFSLAIPPVKAAYDTFITSAAAVAAAEAAVTALGDRPTYPINVVNATTDWNNITNAIVIYDTNMAAALATLDAAQKTNRTDELIVIHNLGYEESGNVIADYGIVYDNWVKVVGAGAGILTYTHWIGFGYGSTYLTVVTSQPTQAYPNF